MIETSGLADYGIAFVGLTFAVLPATATYMLLTWFMEKDRLNG